MANLARELALEIPSLPPTAGIAVRCHYMGSGDSNSQFQFLTCVASILITSSPQLQEVISDLSWREAPSPEGACLATASHK